MVNLNSKQEALIAAVYAADQAYRKAKAEARESLQREIEKILAREDEMTIEALIERDKAAARAHLAGIPTSQIAGSKTKRSGLSTSNHATAREAIEHGLKFIGGN